jgi:hypothetical protein
VSYGIAFAPVGRFSPDDPGTAFHGETFGVLLAFVGETDYSDFFDVLVDVSGDDDSPVWRAARK